MSSEDKNAKLAKVILEQIGGAKNVDKVTHCATRLRLFLNDDSNVSLDDINKLPGVVSAIKNAGQHQIVIGQHVSKVYDEFVEAAGIAGKPNQSNEGNQSNTSVLNKIIGTMSAVFAPFVYILAASGILQALLIILTTLFPTVAETGTYQIFNIVSWAPFVFLPIFIAITASRHFGSNTYIAVAASMALVSPDLSNIIAQVSAGEEFRFFGFLLSETTYTSSVLPALFLVWGLSYLEKYLDRIFPEVARPILTPLFAIVISVPLTLLVVGPITAGAANLVAAGYNFIYNFAPVVAGALVGGLWQMLVMFGIHWGIMPIMLANFDQYGMDSLQAFTSLAVSAQVGAALGVAIKAKKQEIKQAGISGFLPGIFGITEPAIYGVNLRFKKPFIIASISGAIAALVASLFGAHYFAFTGLPGPLTVFNALNSEYPMSFWGELLGVAIAIILPVILIQIFGYGEDAVDEVVSDIKVTEGDTQTDELISKPLEGKVVALEDVPDPVFASGMMGQGVGIQPTAGQVVAPFDGEVILVAGTKHAVGLRSNGGVEILIHVGLETVGLEGRPFTTHVTEGDKVSRGQLLIEADLDMIKSEGLPTVTPVVVTNTADYMDVEVVLDGEEVIIVHK
ncbi:beta-glucoside-specific PTS transporter subunit IIABC [Ruoffia sp. FAM 20857]|uniref:beta-glucoside-specific PTS transporter subunit IIABC n=1 Tax=unclassified Ruoffia TaxID=2862149 RepID=UPI0038883016